MALTAAKTMQERFSPLTAATRRGRRYHVKDAARGQRRLQRIRSALNDLVMTGPTLTNVNDFRAILLQKRN